MDATSSYKRMIRPILHNYGSSGGSNMSTHSEDESNSNNGTSTKAIFAPQSRTSAMLLPSSACHKSPCSSREDAGGICTTTRLNNKHVCTAEPLGRILLEVTRAGGQLYQSKHSNSARG